MTQDARDFSELLDQHISNQTHFGVEGRRGVESLCTVARAVGYKDPQYFGQLTRTAALGDLVLMLEDNPGMVEAMFEWMSTQNNTEWKENILASLEETVL